ncbi:MAG: hypothetical protein WKF67_07845, partial [Rubrobacteraceae bacterium]
MSGWYGPGKQNLAGAGNALTAVLAAQVIDEATYVYARTHATMEIANVPAASKTGSPVTLASVTLNAAGEIDCADFTVSSLTGNTSEAVLIYIETAAADASRIPLLYINGLSIVPNGGNYVFQIASSSPYLGRF